jgi:F420-dependent oxidoreductase-like protein
MEIGIAIGDVRGRSTVTDLVDQARSAVDAGCGTVWCSQALGWDALTALTAVGGQVPNIGLGTAVVPVPQRHPLVLASQALSVQAATGNRLTLGIGAGIAMMVGSMFGLPTDSPARRMREYLTVLGPLLRGDRVDHHGNSITAVGEVHVPGATTPSLLLAALGPEMLRLAGHLTDGAVTWMTGPRTLADHVVPTVTKASAEAGRPAPRVVAGLLACVTHDEDGARERIAEQFGLAGQVPEYRAVLDREGAQGPADVVIVGNEETVLDGVQQLRDSGVTDFMAAPFGTAEEQRRTLAALAALSR